MTDLQSRLHAAVIEATAPIRPMSIWTVIAGLLRIFAQRKS